MTIGPGVRIAHYEITAVVGAGGMGEVFRARDTDLSRDVAIKVLPELFAADRDRTIRFEREAQTLAALNHPNIAQVFGLVELPSGTGLQRRGLVMELVEGRGLDEMIPGVELEEALAIARQIADGLEAAHDRGIVHRDLKPANIRVRDDGVVKVLDFGLAKAMAGPEIHAENSPTFTSPAMTQMGVILGTAAYMAPEQAKGRAVDRRADIWAFGCVLFEMLSGRVGFARDSVAETLSAILSQEPDWSSLPPGTPYPVRHLLRRCLERDPRNRLRDIGEARIVLTGPSTGPTSEGDGTGPDLRDRRSRIPGGAALVAAAAAGAAVTLFAWTAWTEAPGSREITLRQLTELPGAELQPDLSPDGRLIVFTSAAAGNDDVYLLRVGGARPINLTAASQAPDRQPAFSPDGESIAFRSEREGGGIFLMGATGESVRRVTDAGYDPAWSPDGGSLAFATEPTRDPYARYGLSQLWTVEITGGAPRRILDTDAVQPTWSPGGSRIAYWSNLSGQRDIFTVARNGGPPVRVTNDTATDWSPEWSPDGKWLYFSSDRGGSMNVWRIAIDERTGEVTGEPLAVTSSLMSVGYLRFGSDPSRAVVMGYGATHTSMLTRVGDAGADEPPISTIRSPSLGWCSPSPSADWLACTNRMAQEDVVLVRPDGSETIRLTDDAPKDRNPSWSPDGERVGFMSTRSGRWELWSVRRDGSDLRQMTDLDANIYDMVWSTDGRRALTAATIGRPAGSWVFGTERMATRETARFVAHPTERLFSAESWSPDGTSVAGSFLDDGGRPRQPAVWNMATGEVRALDVPPPVNRFSFAVAGWLGDGRRFLFASGKGLVAIDTATGRWAPFPAPEDAIRYRLSADGRTLLSERETLDADVWLVHFARADR